MSPSPVTRVLALVTAATVLAATVAIVYRQGEAPAVTTGEAFGVLEMKAFSERLASVRAERHSLLEDDSPALVGSSGWQPLLWSSVETVPRRALDTTANCYYESYYAVDSPCSGSAPPTPTPEPWAPTAQPTVEPTDAPAVDTTQPTPEATQPVVTYSLSGAVVLSGHVSSALLEFSGDPSATAVSDAGGEFGVELTSDSAGDLQALPGGSDSFTGLTVRTLLVLPKVEQHDRDAEPEVAVTPFTTLAYYIKGYFPVMQLADLFGLVETSLGLQLPAGATLGGYNPVSQAVQASSPAELSEAASNLAASSALMNLVASGSRLYSSACGVDETTASGWMFQAITDAGPRKLLQINLFEKDGVEAILTSPIPMGLCMFQSSTAGRRLQQPGFDAEVIERSAEIIAEATAELNTDLKESAAAASGPGQLLTQVAVRSLVAQQQLAGGVAQLVSGEVSADVFSATYTGDSLASIISSTELPEAGLEAVANLTSQDALGEPSPVSLLTAPVATGSTSQFSAGELVGIILGPIFGVALISAAVFAGIFLYKHRRSAVQRLDPSSEVDAETGLMSTAGHDEEEGATGAGSIADENTYYKMAAPEPPRSPAPLPSRKDPLAPAQKPSTDYQGMDLVSQAKKVEEEKARQDFEAILRAQQEYMAAGPGEGSKAVAEPPAPGAQPSEPAAASDAAPEPTAETDEATEESPKTSGSPGNQESS